VLLPGISIWSLSDDLINAIINTVFEQQDSSALIRGVLPNGKAYNWLYTAKRYYPISPSEHEMFWQAAKSRGHHYSLELCDFTIEELRPNGDLVLNFRRRSSDDAGEEGRAILSQRHHTWVNQRLSANKH
jgi:hypothetical protein